MWIGTKAPTSRHPRPQGRTYPAVSPPHPPSFDEKDVSDKPGWVSDNPPLSLEQKNTWKSSTRKRFSPCWPWTT